MMAECQATFHYTEDVVTHLVHGLSKRRCEPYMRRAGFRPDIAFQLYLYNARLAKSFLFPLHVVEVVLRNAVDDILSSRFTTRWPVSAEFRSLLTPPSLASLQKAIDRTTKRRTASKDDVVAHLTFDFWSNLFRPEYDRPLWQAGMQALLPNAALPRRADFQRTVSRINRLRNRIAHHESILDENATQKFKEIVDVVRYRSVTTADWLRSHATVHQVIRNRPSLTRGLTDDAIDRS
ncbi:hypothetical protein [Pinirhizobacter sp.]|jgi:hypothetical protein|uniref:hypothetical protein n=1 Tax=Pinirhizobacter sp. TaxID=2950432 RepID=UPI002F3FD4E9